MLCLACKIIKPQREFYKNVRMLRGYLNQCKDCVKERIKTTRKDNVPEYRARDNARSMRPDRVKARLNYKATDAGKASHNKTTRKWAASNTEKRKAHILVSNALRAGRLTRKSCYKCSSIKVQAHHEDYKKPLDVIWCCARHHKEFHK